MNWIEERHSGDKGYRSECGNWYIGMSGKKYWWIYHRDGALNWSKVFYRCPHPTLSEAKSAVLELCAQM